MQDTINATEYFKKFKDGLQSKDKDTFSSAAISLCEELYDESVSIYHSKHLSTDADFRTIISKQNKKGNEIVDMMEHKTLKKDFFQTYYNYLLKEAKQHLTSNADKNSPLNTRVNVDEELER